MNLMPSFLSARACVMRAARWCGALLLAATVGAADLGEVYKIDFGPASSCAPGYLANDGGDADPRFLWKGHVSTRDRGGDDLVNRTFVEGRAADFCAGVDNGDYELTLTLRGGGVSPSQYTLQGWAAGVRA